MFKVRCIFTLVIFLIFKQSRSFVVLAPEIENTNIRTAESAIRTTANTLFHTLGLRKIQQNPRLHHYAVVHNHFISKTLQSYDNLKEIVKLTKLDRSNKTKNTTDFIALINEIFNEDNVLKLQNIIMGEVSTTGYDIETEIAKLDFLKEYHAKRDNRSISINKDILRKQNKFKEWVNITRTEEDDDNIDKIPFWNEDNILPERRIFNGKTTKIKKFPFMASVQIFGKFQCAGSVIKSDLVITAASCLQLAWNNRFYRENPTFLTVRVGSSFYEVGGEVLEVLEIYFYPGYDPKALRHNVAIMRLMRKIRLKKKKVQKIEIADTFGDYAGKVLVVGWGAHTAGNQARGAWDDIMRNAALSIYPLEECQNIYSTDYVTQRNFCAGFMSVGGGACNRDVGGPGIISGQLAGVISFGAPQCGKPDAPTVFTKLNYYTDWIEEIMEQDIPGTLKRTTQRPLQFTRFLINTRNLDSIESVDLSVTPVNSQRHELYLHHTDVTPVTDIAHKFTTSHVNDGNGNDLRNMSDKINTSREQLDIVQQKLPVVNAEQKQTIEEIAPENESYKGQSGEPIDIIQQKQPEVEVVQNVSKEVETVPITEKSNTEDIIQSYILRTTVMDYSEKAETENESNQEQATKNSYKPTYLEKSSQEKLFTNIYKSQFVHGSKGYSRPNETEYPNTINNPIYPKNIKNNQDDAVTPLSTKLGSFLPDKINNTKSIFHFTSNTKIYEKKHKNLYPEVLMDMLEKADESNKKYFTGLQVQTSEVVKNTQSKASISTAPPDGIQTTDTAPVQITGSLPFFEVYTQKPSDSQTVVKLDNLDTSSTEAQDDDKAAYLEPLIEAQDYFTTKPNLSLDYQEEIRMAYQHLQQQQEEQLADLIAYQLLLSPSEAELVNVNQEPQTHVQETINRDNRAHYPKNLTNPTSLIQVQTGQRNTTTQNTQTKEKLPLLPLLSENENGIYSLQAKNDENPIQDHKEVTFIMQTDLQLEGENAKNLSKQEFSTRIGQSEGKSENLYKSLETDNDLNLENQEPSLQSPRETKLYASAAADKTPAAEILNIVNPDSLIPTEEKDTQDNRADSMLDEEDSNLESYVPTRQDNKENNKKSIPYHEEDSNLENSEPMRGDYDENNKESILYHGEDSNLENSEPIREDYEEDNKNSIPYHEERNLMNIETLRKSQENVDHQSESVLVDKDISYKEQPIEDEEEVKSYYNQDDSILIDKIVNLVNSESLKDDQKASRMDNQTIFLKSNEYLNSFKDKSFTQVTEASDIELATFDNTAQFLKFKKSKKIMPINITTLTQTEVWSKSDVKENCSNEKCLSQTEKKTDSYKHNFSFNSPQTENRAQQYDQKIEAMSEQVTTQAKQNDKVLLNNRSKISNLKPSYLSTRPQKDLSAPIQTKMLKVNDVIISPKEELESTKIANEMDAEMKHFLENKIDKAVISLLYPQNIRGDENYPFINIDRNLPILLDYGTIIKSKTVANENPTQPSEGPIIDETIKIRQRLEENVEKVTNRNHRQQLRDKTTSQTSVFEVPLIHEKDVKRLRAPAKVEMNNHNKKNMHIKNISTEFYSEEGTLEKIYPESVSNGTFNLKKARRAMYFVDSQNNSGSVESGENNTTEVRIDSKEADAIKRNVLDYINI